MVAHFCKQGAYSMDKNAIKENIMLITRDLEAVQLVLCYISHVLFSFVVDIIVVNILRSCRRM